MEPNTAELDRVAAWELDPRRKPFWKPGELSRLGMGSHQTVLDAIEAEQIPCLRVGRKVLIPTSWLRRQMQLPDIDLNND